MTQLLIKLFNIHPKAVLIENVSVHSDTTADRHKEPVAASAGLVQRSSSVDSREAPSSDPPGADPDPIDIKLLQSPPAVPGRPSSDGEAVNSHTIHLPASAGAGSGREAADCGEGGLSESGGHGDTSIDILLLEVLPAVSGRFR